jgi:periplasmic protein CpxP/Spy
MKRRFLKSWTKRLVFGALSGAVLFGGLSACSHGPARHGGYENAQDSSKFRARMMERVTAQLELNPEQVTRLGVLADKMQQQRLALRGQDGHPAAQVQSLFVGDKLDRIKAQALVSEKTAAVSSKSPEVITALGDFYDGLNPVQQQKVRDFLQKGGARWRARG